VKKAFEDLEALIASVMGDDVEVSIERYPSGAVSIELRFHGHFGVIEGLASGDQWGVSVDFPDDHGFLGHDNVYSSSEEAVRNAWALLSR
jgi:hypothetical protein